MPATTTDPGKQRWRRRAAWFVGLWLAGVAAVGGLALLVRLLIKAAS